MCSKLVRNLMFDRNLFETWYFTRIWSIYYMCAAQTRATSGVVMDTVFLLNISKNCRCGRRIFCRNLDFATRRKLASISRHVTVEHFLVGLDRIKGQTPYKSTMSVILTHRRRYKLIRGWAYPVTKSLQKSFASRQTYKLYAPKGMPENCNDLWRDKLR